MDPRDAATRVSDPDAVEFVTFCYRRRRVGWPELYDEMCAVAARGLYRGYSADDLDAHGIRFGLFDMPALAAMTREIVAAEVAARRPVAVVITSDEHIAVPVAVPVAGPRTPEPTPRPTSVDVELRVSRLVAAPVGA